MPEGLVTLRIAADTGMLASGENPDAILETFMTDHLPGGGSEATSEGPTSNGPSDAGGGDPIF